MLEASSILGKKIFVLTAHPDDESYLAAGTIHANKQAEGQTFLVCATLGEKGASHLAKPMSEEALKDVRHAELKETCSLLKVDRVFDMDLPDGGVANHTEELMDRVSPLISFLQPELIMSFGSDGITGHHDHIAVSEVAAKLAEQHNLPLATFCIPSEVAEECLMWLKEKRATKGHYVSDFNLGQENLCIPIDAQTKMRALKCYQSQINQQNPFSGFPDHIAQALLEKECFYLKQPTL